MASTFGSTLLNSSVSLLSHAGASIVFGVILGTGVGGGIVIGGHLLGGADGIAGEWGHNPLPWPRDDVQGFAAREEQSAELVPREPFTLS